jgi:hypothetical protein
VAVIQTNIFGEAALRRDRLHHDAQLVPGRADRFGLSHHAVLAVDVEVQLVSAVGRFLPNLAAAPLDHAVDVGDRVGVTHGGDPEEALAHAARAFELHPDRFRANELRAGDARRALVELLVAAVAHVQHASCEVLVVRIGPLVHGVAGDGGDRATLLRTHGRDLHVLHRDLAQDRLLAAIRFGAEGGALHHLAQVIGEAFGEAGAERGRGEEYAVAAAAADDDVGALVEQLDVGMDAGHRDHVVGGVESVRIEVGTIVEPLDGLAAVHGGAQPILGDARVEVAQPERRQVVLGGQLLDDADEEINAAVAAGVAGRADDHDGAGPPCGEQHVLQVVRLPVERAGEPGVAAERDRTDVAASGVRDDEVRIMLQTEAEAGGSQRRVTEMPVGAQEAKWCAIHDERSCVANERTTGSKSMARVRVSATRAWRR